MTQEQDTPWVPTETDKNLMKLLFDIGRTYGEFYLTNYGYELSLMLNRLAVTILKMKCDHELDKKDELNFMKLQAKLKSKVEQIQSPPFSPGQLVMFNKKISGKLDDANVLGTIVGAPYVCEMRQKIVIDVLINSCIIPCDLSLLKPAVRKRRRVR